MGGGWEERRLKESGGSCPCGEWVEDLIGERFIVLNRIFRAIIVFIFYFSNFVTIFSRGVARGPLARRLIVQFSVAEVLFGNRRDERIVGIRFGKQSTNREQDLGNRERWRPLVFQNIETNGSLTVDIATV